MAAVYAVVASGFAVSSAVVLFPSDRRWSIQVPSMTGNAVRVEFATSSAATDFGAIHMRPGLTDVVASSTVRPAWGWLYPVTPYARVHPGGGERGGRRLVRVRALRGALNVPTRARRRCYVHT